MILRLLITLLLGSWMGVTWANTPLQVLYVRPANSAKLIGEQIGEKHRFYQTKSIIRDVLLKGESFQVVIKSDKEIPKDLVKYDIIILPEIICLSDQDLDHLYQYVQNGGGLFMSGGIGSYTPSGEWRGYSFFYNLMGTEPVAVTNHLNEIEALHFRYGYPGTLAIPPACFLPITPYTAPLTLKHSDAVDILAYWSEGIIGNKDPKDIPREVGFVVREIPDGGRIAWVGADVEGLDISPERKPYYLPFFHQLWNWLAGKAIVGLEPWPMAKKNAILIHGDIETNFHLVENILEPLRKYRVKSTFNLLLSEAEKVPKQLIEDLRNTGGELGSHAYEHNHFWGQPFRIQLERLQRFQNASQKYNFTAKGLRPPYLAHDDSTLEAVRQMGMLYITADKETYANYPRVVYGKGEYAKKGVVLYPKGELDDYDIFYVLQTKDQREVSRMFLTDYFRLRDCRGLYQFNYHSQFLNTPQLTVVLDSLLEIATQDQSVWIATAEEISSWILERDQLHLTSSYQNQCLRVVVKNHGNDTQWSSYLKIVNPLPKGNATKPTATKKETKTETLQYRQDIVPNEEGLVAIPPLKNGETFAFEIVFNQSASSTMGSR
ncbi:MAG: polysaccharide deacetylase family protein [bacterium]|nr:polysaccharide deacetylase family protein [bacterium]